MEIITAEEVKRQTAYIAAGEYSELLQQMPSGSAIKIHTSEWRKKTPPNYYFLGRYNQGGKKKVSVRRIKDYYLVIKL